MRKRGIFVLIAVFFYTLFCFGVSVPTINADGENILADFFTYYNQNDGGRSENIRLSARFIDGIILQGYGEFSFNQTVGKRTKENGFKEAKVIVSGEFVQGVGGGVCQVSTTLYNASLLAGLSVSEFHPHSLEVSYVPPSRDAMVSLYSDLKIFNPYPFPVKFGVSVKNGVLRVRIFGKGEGYTFKLVSQVLETVAPPNPIEKEGEEDKILRRERAGVKSVCYLEKYRKGTLVAKNELRADEYRPIQGMIVKKITRVSNKIA